VLSWAERSGRRHEWAQVLALREGTIVGMQDYTGGRRPFVRSVAGG
jgi:hypothetical protein